MGASNSDLMATAGVDLSEFEKGITRLETRLGALEKHGEKAVTSLGKLEKAGKTLNKLLTFSIAGIGLKTLAGYALDLGKNLDAISQKYIAGSARAKAAGGGSDSGVSRSLGAGWEDLQSRAKIKAGQATAKAAEGYAELFSELAESFHGGLLNNASDPGSMAGQFRGQHAKNIKELARKMKLGAEADRLTDVDIPAKEDEIAEYSKNGIVTMDQQKTLQEKIVELATMRLKLAENELVTDRQMQLAAKAMIEGASKANIEREFAITQAENAARAQTDIMEQERDGRKDVANIMAIQAKYQAQIAAAQKDGLDHVVEELNVQKEIELTKAKVASHTMTARQRIDERRDARKYARDVTKTQNAEISLEARSQRMIAEHHKATPGSELARYQARGMARVGGRTDAQTVINILNKINDAISE